MITVNIAGTNKPITKITTAIPSLGNTDLTSVWVGTASGNKLIYSGQPLTVVVSPNNIFATKSFVGPVTTSTTTAYPSYGTGSYTYAWTRTSGSTDITIDSPTSATTSFTKTGGSSSIATFTCTVTDSLGHTASDSVDVDVEPGGTIGVA